MFVRNDVTVDARVLKEAATLHDAGHEVTIVGRTRPGTPHARRARAARRVRDRPRSDAALATLVAMAPGPVAAVVDHPPPRRGAGRADGCARLARDVAVRDARLGAGGGPRGRCGRRLPRPRPHWPAGRCLRTAAPPERPARLRQPRALPGVGAAVAGRPGWAVALARSSRAGVVGEGGRPRHGQRRDRRRPRTAATGTIASSSSTTARRARWPPSMAPTGSAPRDRHLRDGAPVVAVRTAASGRAAGSSSSPRRCSSRGSNAPISRSSGSGRCGERLVALAAEPRFGGRVHVLEPVPPDEVVALGGLGRRRRPCRSRPTNRAAHYLSTPNKLFEALAAGVPVVASDFAGHPRRSSSTIRTGRSASCATRRIRGAIGRRDPGSILDLSPEARADLPARAGERRASAGTGRRSRPGWSSCTATSRRRRDEPAAAEAVAQRCTLVLPSSGAFDSRAWRIASALAARGHAVTVLARLEPGLAAEETHEAGYRIIRVPVSAAAGLPGPLRWLWTRLRRRSGTRGANLAAPGRRPTPRRRRGTGRSGPVGLRPRSSVWRRSR